MSINVPRTVRNLFLWTLVAGLCSGDRSGDVLFFDGAQAPFNTTFPPSPGFIYLTPRKTPTALISPWFEFTGSFSIQFWMKPIRVFLGTDIEGGIVGCLVRPLSDVQSGYGVTITSDTIAHFFLTVQRQTRSLNLQLELNKWVHLTAWYDSTTATARLYFSEGTGLPPTVADSHTYPGIPPFGVDYFDHNDLLLGKLQPLFGEDYYYSGYLDELRFWSRALSLDEITDAVYRVYAPFSVQLNSIGLVGYWPMNAVKCTEELCGLVIALQQWIFISGIVETRFTSSLVLYASPRATPTIVADCRSEQNAGQDADCLCAEFQADYCWDPIAQSIAECSTCPGCEFVRCYGPFSSARCLEVRIPGTLAQMSLAEKYPLEIQPCGDENPFQKFTKTAAGFGRLQVSASPLFCIATVTEGPFRGSAPIVEACIFQNGNTAPIPSQAWAIDPSGLKARNELTGMCLTASSLLSGSTPYMVDCISVDLFNPDALVQSFLFDWANGRNGIVVDGSFLTSNTKCNGVSLCEASTKAPIDQGPILEAVNGVALTTYTIADLAYVSLTYSLTITARDPNRNDRIQFDFLPYDEGLLSDETVEWPPAFICRGGINTGQNCTCEVESAGGVACPGSLVCPGGTCVMNSANGCPANPCSRTFLWTPGPFAEFLNPSTLVFIASDYPVNELLNPPDISRSDFPLRVVVTVRMPPQFEAPTPRYVCEGGTLAGNTYRARTPCIITCEAEGGGVCRTPRLTVEIGNCVSFTARASNREPGSTISIKFLTEGPDVVSPSPSRVTIGPDEPTPTFIADPDGGEGLVEIFVMNPITKTWTFCPNTVDAGRLYQACFVAYNPVIGLTPEATTEVNCVEIEVLVTNPLFDNPSPANGSTIEGYVGCPVNFQMASLKNDSAIYDLLVTPSASFFQTFNGTLIPLPGLPEGSVWYSADSSDVRLTYTFEWTPEEGQEGTRLLCFDTSDSFFVTTERRCVFVEVVRCLRCVRPGETLELIGQLYNAHWLELYAINPALHMNPALLSPGTRVYVGILYRTPRLQDLPQLAKYLHTTPTAIRQLNPDIMDDEEEIGAFKRVCVLPEVCGPECGNAAYCSRTALYGNAPALV